MGDSESSASTPLVPFFKKAKGRPSSLSSRRRSASPSSLADPSTSSVIKPKVTQALNPLRQGTKRAREDREKDRESLAAWKADEAPTGAGIGGMDLATRGSDWDLETAGESSGSAVKRPRLDEDGNLVPADGLYKGLAGYHKHLTEDPRNAMSNKMKAGPQKASASIRSITVTDYQPDVCKDYKETGFCGYGDSCKFMHDRGDYLAGWQLDKLVVNPVTGEPAEEESDDEDVPFACLICREKFRDPVVTKCGHYFDMDCAVKRYAKGQSKCYACGAATGGMFNKAEKILAKMEAKNKARAEKRGKDMFGNKKEEDEEGVEDAGIEFGGEDEDEDQDEE